MISSKKKKKKKGHIHIYLACMNETDFNYLKQLTDRNYPSPDNGIINFDSNTSVLYFS